MFVPKVRVPLARKSVAIAPRIATIATIVLCLLRRNVAHILSCPYYARMFLRACGWGLADGCEFPRNIRGYNDAQTHDTTHTRTLMVSVCCVVLCMCLDTAENFRQQEPRQRWHQLLLGRFLDTVEYRAAVVTEEHASVSDYHV